jgi:hypothetical protein
VLEHLHREKQIPHDADRVVVAPLPARCFQLPHQALVAQAAEYKPEPLGDGWPLRSGAWGEKFAIWAQNSLKTGLIGQFMGRRLFWPVSIAPCQAYHEHPK